MTERVLVTGANGFVGKSLCRKLIASGFIPRAGIRDLAAWPLLQRSVRGLNEFSLLGDLGRCPRLRDSLAGASAVVHLAARVHVMNESAAEPLRAYRSVNVEGTKALALSAAAAGVRRFVFVSTIKVHGEETRETPFTEDAPPHPRDAYAVSKWEAEEALRSIAAASGLDVVIVRPPLVYGPGVGGNFLRMLRWVARETPLPIPANGNCRSVLGADNLSDFLVHCIRAPEAGGQSFLVKDSESVSTRELVVRLARALGCSARFLPIPAGALRLAACLIAKKTTAGRLLDSLVIDSSKAQQKLNWFAPVTLEAGLAATARWFRNAELPAQPEAG